ncbi:hypothetical protein SR870_23810 [Rhodopseudomonas palustris]|uniref:hypothetical protein n=1 Tax=Rhodopseudomonas palustris TaxID=1076 RepID=UPI002ACD2F31|nr:hypothetical protein [Rhodopseudomonas palustris]WQG99655.1 hypothetical protein SR870_23810 [Rhodopseudomonas palustris]
MAKIDLDALSIEELASLRDDATLKLSEKVAARQAELEAELAALSRYGKPAKKAGADSRSDGKTRDGVAKDVGAKEAATKAA